MDLGRAPAFPGGSGGRAYGGERTLLLPGTYMNESGRAVADAAHFYRLGLPDIVVFHDEIDLAPAKVRVKTGGGIAGHNGLRSVTEHIGNDYRRVRIGVGHPGVKEMVHAYVLDDFAKDERSWVEALCGLVADNADLLAKRQDASFQNKVHLGMQAKGLRSEGDGSLGWAAFCLARFKKINKRHVMGFKCGILGLSNVGKSTLFNALTATAAAQASNYPFSTIEPNVGEVMVPDPLDVLATLAKSAKIKPTRLTFVDIAGLVSGASRGEGLGNQFLAHVREVDAIAHVVRCFEDKEIAHVSGALDPVADRQHRDRADAGGPGQPGTPARRSRQEGKG